MSKDNYESNAAHFGPGVYCVDMEDGFGKRKLLQYALNKYEADIDAFSEDEEVMAVIEAEFNGEYLECISAKKHLAYTIGYLFIEDTKKIKPIKSTPLKHSEEFIKSYFNNY